MTSAPPAAVTPALRESARWDFQTSWELATGLALINEKEEALEEASKIEKENPEGKATVLSYGEDSEKKHITYYFRQDFEVSNGQSTDKLTLRVAVDDGAVVYLNGHEVLRVNLPEGDVEHETLAPVALSNASTTTSPRRP